jgi:hypothetical protein
VTQPPFVTQLRARTSTITLATPGAEAITIRVEMPEVWDVVRITTLPGEPVIVIKQRALEALAPESRHHENFVIKLRGWEILDEAAPLRGVGVVDGSILLLTHRRRRPVR